MKALFSILLIFSSYAQAPKPTPKPDGGVMMEASLSIAKKICAAHPEANVWIFRVPNWSLISCGSLPAIFALDVDNSFDSMIPLMQEIRDGNKQGKSSKNGDK